MSSSGACLPALTFSIAERGQLVTGHGPIVPRQLVASDDQALLVPLARQQHGVAWPRALERRGDARAPPDDADVSLTLAGAGLLGARRDLAQDGDRVLLARVFIGDHGEVGEMGRDLAHQWALHTVALARRAKDRDQAARCDGT